MAQKIIGRKLEIKELLDLYKENKPVFAVISVVTMDDLFK